MKPIVQTFSTFRGPNTHCEGDVSLSFVSCEQGEQGFSFHEWSRTAVCMSSHYIHVLQPSAQAWCKQQLKLCSLQNCLLTARWCWSEWPFKRPTADLGNVRTHDLHVSSVLHLRLDDIFVFTSNNTSMSVCVCVCVSVHVLDIGIIIVFLGYSLDLHKYIFFVSPTLLANISMLTR